MTETKNFALKLPDPTDMVDIGVLNENFEKIDEELASKYYDLDLRELVSVSSKNDANQQFDVASLVDIDALNQALAEKKTVRVLIKTEDESIEAYGATVYICLNDVAVTDADMLNCISGVTAVYGIGAYEAALNVTAAGSVYFYWKAIQGASAEYYELDLRGKVELDLTDGSSVTWVVLTDGHTNLTDLMTVAKAGERIRVHFTFADKLHSYNVSVPIISRKETLDGYIDYGGDLYDFAFGTHIYTVHLSFSVSGDLITLSLMDTFNAYRAGLVTKETPANTKVVKSDSTVTITTTLEGDKQSVTTITVDENDYPTKINTDGTEWPVTWEGFEAAEDDSVGLPVVELSTEITDGAVLTEAEMAALTQAYKVGTPAVFNLTIQGMQTSIIFMRFQDMGFAADVGYNISFLLKENTWEVSAGNG